MYNVISEMNGPVPKKSGLVRKKTAKTPTTPTQTQKKKIYVKIGYSGYDSGKNFLLKLFEFYKRNYFFLYKMNPFQ